MRKILIFAALVSVTVSAQEISIHGSRGMFKLQYAQPHEMGMLSFHFAALERFETARVELLGDSINDRKHFLEAVIGMSYAINDYIEMRFHAAPLVKYYEANDYPVTRGDPHPVFGISQYEIGLKLGYPLIVDAMTPSLYAFGIDSRVDFGPAFATDFFGNAQDKDRILYAEYSFPPYIPHDPDFGFTALFDFRTGPFAAHLNLGYVITGEDQQPDYVADSDFVRLRRTDYIPHGIGIELLPAEGLKVLFEAYGHAATGFDSESLWITPGLRFGSRNLSFDVGCEFGLVGTSYWKAFFNLSGGYDLAVKPAVPVARVSGNVSDAKTGAPLAATLSFPDTEQGALQTPANGSYEISLAPGSYRIRADAPDYRWREQSVVLKDGDKITLDFQLQRKPVAKIAGRIYDAETNAPVMTTITFPQTEFANVTSDTAGFYSADLLPGTFRLRVEAANYQLVEKVLNLAENETKIVDIALHRGGILTGKVSEYETGRALLAQITFVNTALPRVTTDAATGIYQVAIPPGTYSVIVEAADYITESAPVILAQNETKIQNFVLKPIPRVGERIVLKGITFDFNSAVIKPVSYPVLDDAARVLKAKPTMRVEIGGHTDSIGSDSYNMMLSNERAIAVRDYFIRYHNIDPTRLAAVGYGETQPIADNRTRSGRDMNRRIEFKVLSW
ncbi:carboxypeptidase regulatory-like domain-containing protein [candidate division WOR-3 bacterium]|nr:carboxypeptidase regulatory-like domain-containing protein [candidate division WOR-3 bacterium]